MIINEPNIFSPMWSSLQITNCKSITNTKSSCRRCCCEKAVNHRGLASGCCFFPPPPTSGQLPIWPDLPLAFLFQWIINTLADFWHKHNYTILHPVPAPTSKGTGWFQLVCPTILQAQLVLSHSLSPPQCASMEWKEGLIMWLHDAAQRIIICPVCD